MTDEEKKAIEPYKELLEKLEKQNSKKCESLKCGVVKNNIKKNQEIIKLRQENRKQQKEIKELKKVKTKIQEKVKELRSRVKYVASSDNYIYEEVADLLEELLESEE